ncbi:hypothetical protein FB567DRAFT_549159 [Paraphoma chrysanthemicola]|uniref:C3H1-type domain-containing protein n=1 Tax=Paraphoma chrysanthemicola TaxID=798071 RepID=A0A8K0R4Z8_9PLEO|nr:hypothetical protein FB567DRAFT_549159 [Paraphoma chrysanthemicola]
MIRTKLDLPPRPYQGQDISKLPPDEQIRARASIASWVVLVKRMREEQDRIDAASQTPTSAAAPVSATAFAPSHTASPNYSLRGSGHHSTTYRGGGHHGAHHYGTGYHAGPHYGRGGRAGYSPYAGMPRFRNRSAVFNSADSSYDNSDADEVTTLTASPQRNLQAVEKKELCATFTLTGNAAGHCVHALLPMCATNPREGICSRPGCSLDHDPNKLSICKTWLFKGDCPDGEDCSLSHEATEHNTPHCQHFQKGRCTKDDCQFPHVRLNPAALNCEAFGQKGYCEKGSRCAELHAHECPTFANTGTCRYGTKCRLGHVHRASRMKKAARRPSDTPSPLSDPAPEALDITDAAEARNTARPVCDAEAIDASDTKDSNTFAKPVSNAEDPHHFSQQVDYVPLE